MQDLAVELSPPQHRGAIVAIFVGAARLGQTIGPIGAAALFGATSTAMSLNVGAALAVGLGVMFLFAPMHRRVALSS
jgi:predicted phage tail protein